MTVFTDRNVRGREAQLHTVDWGPMGAMVPFCMVWLGQVESLWPKVTEASCSNASQDLSPWRR